MKRSHRSRSHVPGLPVLLAALAVAAVVGSGPRIVDAADRPVLDARGSAHAPGGEGVLEKRVLFGPETAKEWSVAESLLEAAPAPMKAGSSALHWRVTVDHTTGEPNYPIGWPRINHPIPKGPERDWSAWDTLRLQVYTDTSRAALPPEPVGLILYTPDRETQYHRPLLELKKGEWVAIDIPLAAIPRNHDVRLLQFYLTEADYRHGDRLELHIADLSLLRYARPTLLDLAPESGAVFADAPRIPIRFRLAGVPTGQVVAVTCELRRAGKVAAQASVRSGRGPVQLALEPGRRPLEPGEYEVAARVAGGGEARARVRLVASPWR